MTGIRKGQSWGRPATGPPDTEVAGGDAEVAAVAARRVGARVAFRPGPASDLARAIGLTGPGAAGASAPVEVPVDGLRLDRRPDLAVNGVVVGTAPDRMRWWTRARALEVIVNGRSRFAGRATAVVIMNGQFLRGTDIAPRGHPGDGRAEVQVYAPRRGERRAMRRRLPQGAHVPHPRIHEASGRRVEVRLSGGSAPLEADGVDCGRVAGVVVDVVPAVLWMLV